jgi:hypothetical protein
MNRNGLILLQVVGASRFSPIRSFSSPTSCRSRRPDTLIKAGGRLSAEEQRDPAVTAALRDLFERDPDLRVAYKTTP